jgi:hypothetical protein
MRAMQVFLALTMVAACGGTKGPVLYQKDAALGADSNGNGGAAVGTGGTGVGTGGSVGTGGTVLNTGGTVLGTGGTVLGTGGSGGAIGSGGGGASGGAGGSDKDGGLADAAPPRIGSPCSSQSDCVNSALVLSCLAPYEFRGCGFCRSGTSQCTNDADCSNLDGGSTGVVKVCQLAPDSDCYCSYTMKLCVPGCRDYADCGPGQGCNPSHACEATCVPGDGTCAPDFVCGASGFCARKTCTTDAECSVACVKGACYASRGTCEGAAA